MIVLKRVLRDIKDLKIQGATNVAQAGLKVIDKLIKDSKATTPKSLLKEVSRASDKLVKVRVTEPMLKNSLRYINWRISQLSASDFKKQARIIIKNLSGRTDEAKKEVFKIGSAVVKRGDVVLTHCHSSNVMGILKKARPKKVFCTETRPLFQGRITAKELINAGLNVKMIIDSAVANYIKDCDKVLIGCDVIGSNKVVNKVGSRVISLLCEKYDIPLYVCSTSFKFDPESTVGKGVGIEERDYKEVWKVKPKKLGVLNPAFDSIDYDNITSFINELGVLSPDSLFIKLNEVYKWMFKGV
jgi:ribose 1,5-bisphosphate isomerase